MKNQWKKLVSLNLVLVMLISTLCPASALDLTPRSSGEPITDESILIPTRREEEANLLSSDEAYRIEVNGTVFDSETSASGEGWTYYPSLKWIILSNYEGFSIYASGDLTIYSYGESYIFGRAGTNYGADAICVDGTLKLRNYGSELGIMGGSGDLSGGEGIDVGEDFYLTSYGDTYIFGGDTGNSTSSSGNNLWGGYAVLVGGSASFSGSSYSTVYAVGGQSGVNDEHSVDGSSGGYALAALEDIKIDVSFAFLGGEAYAGGPAVYCGGTCTFGAVDGYIYSGDGPYYYKALICDNAPVYSVHTDVVQYPEDSNFPWAIEITRKTYTLDLYGAGGTYNGGSKVSLSAKYPSSHTLSNYLFQREGYVQVAWATASDLIPLNQAYTPTGDTILVAHWLAAEKGDIVLNALSGTFDSDGSMYQKYSTEVQLPSEVTFSKDSILAWCDEIAPVADANSYTYSGRWYACGDTVSPDPESVTQLYAQRANSGLYALYHLNGGQSAEGGTLLVQGGYAATHDLTVYTPSASDITAPEGYEFDSWYIPETDTYLSENVSLDLSDGNVLMYAQWVPIQHNYMSESGIRISITPVLKTVTVTIPADTHSDLDAHLGLAALYDSSGKLLTCRMETFTAGEDLTLTFTYSGDEIPICKAFLLSDQYTPVCDIAKTPAPK